MVSTLFTISVFRSSNHNLRIMTDGSFVQSVFAMQTPDRGV